MLMYVVIFGIYMDYAQRKSKATSHNFNMTLTCTSKMVVVKVKGRVKSRTVETSDLLLRTL